MASQAELAFRTLQAGLNTGKIVVRVGCHSSIGDKGGTQIVTGGTGALGLLTARWLADQGAAHLILTSRSDGRSASFRPEWNSLTATSVVAMPQRCDSAEPSDLRRLMKTNLAPLFGVWHAAGVLADRLLPSQTAYSMRHVYAPKAHGAWALHAAGSTSGTIRNTVYFSSVAALLGNPGQTNYSAANACLDALARYRSTHGQVAVSIQWGPWGESGMAVSDAASGRMSASGFRLITPAGGLKALHELVAPSAATVVSVLPIDWTTYVSNTGTVSGTGDAVPAFLSHMVRPRSSGQQGVCHAPVTVTRTASLDTVLELAKRTAGSTVDADAPLMDEGIDSLGAVELRNQLQRVLGSEKNLPSTIVFDPIQQHGLSRRFYCRVLRRDPLRPKYMRARKLQNAQTYVAHHCR